MKKILTVENMRKSDAYTIANYVPSKDLMFRAGKGVFNELLDAGVLSTAKNDTNKHKRIAIVCGSGNNAGDGYVLAQLIAQNCTNCSCELLLLKDKFSNDGKYYFDKCIDLGISWRIVGSEENFFDYDIIIDCILGTGFTGDVRGPAADVIRSINKVSNKKSSYVVAVDINSGLNGDTGQSNLCVHSHLTICIGGYKPGVLRGIATSVCGEVVNVDIGIKPVDKPYLLVDNSEVEKLTPKDLNNYVVIRDISEIPYDS